MSKIDCKTFKKEDIDSEFFFIWEENGVPQIKIGTLVAIITMTQRLVRTGLTERMGLEYNTQTSLKLYNKSYEKYYTLSPKEVYDNYADVCEAYKKYVR